MVSSEEVIERSFYMSLLRVALVNNLTLNPDDYLPSSVSNEKRYNEDKARLKKFVSIFGVGNSQSRGQKILPRITLELQGYYPGSMGVEKFSIDNSAKLNPIIVESEYSTKDVIIDVHLVTSNQADMRLLHTIMYHALPAMGYIKPYYNDQKEYFENGLAPTNNIFIEIGNYYDHSDTDHGILEKVYSYTIKDGFVIEDKHEPGELVPIKDISVLLDAYQSNQDQTFNIQGSNNT